MSLSAVLSQNGVSVGAAQQYLAQRVNDPTAVYQAAQQLHLTTGMLAELSGISATTINAYFGARGLSGAALDAGATAKTNYVFLSDLADGDIFIYNPVSQSGQKVASFGRPITDIATAANGDIYATDFSAIFRFGFSTGAVSRLTTHNGSINSLSTHNGQLVAASSLNGEVTTFNLTTGQQIASTTLPGGSAAGDIAFVGNDLYRTTIFNGLMRTDASGTTTQVVGSLASEYFGLTTSPDNHLVAFASDGKVRSYTPETGAVAALATVQLTGLNTVSGAAEASQAHVYAFA